MKILTTPASQFEGLPDYNFAPHYHEVAEGLKMHYLDEGPSDGEVVLLLHGEPSWSFLYRFMIPVYVEAGYRVIVPDLIGFGKSDKPSEQSDYTYLAHVDWVKALVFHLDLQGINLFCQDWGGLIGLRIATEEEARFARICASNTFLPFGKGEFPKAFLDWRAFSRTVPSLPVGKILQASTTKELSDEIIAAYNAPFPDVSYQAGAKIFPSLVPITEDDPAVPANQAAWTVLAQWKKPFLTLFGDNDPITKGSDKWLQSAIPGCKDQPHEIIKDGGHFIQEDKGEELATKMIAWMQKS